jgi:ribosomal protein S18 acetylase RimI-like enzyme
MDISYRAMMQTEVGEAAEVFLTTLADLARRNGQPPPKMFTRQSVDPVYAHLFETGIFRVAELRGRIISICSALVRDELWFLSMYWTLPEFQQRKVGGPLLRQVWEEGQRQGATRAFTWSSIDYAAMATYMKLGMLPGSQIFTFAGRPAKLPAPADSYELETLKPTSATRIDSDVRGTARAVDHAFWARSSTSRWQVVRDGEAVGYFYVTDGVVGPAGWTDPTHGRTIVALALREASQQSADVRLMATGTNHVAIALVLRSGMRLVGSSHLLLTHPLGVMEQYLPSGPALF